MLLTPLHSAIVISVFVQRVKVWPWRSPPGNPCVRNDAYIRVAGELLPEHFNAMV